MEIIESTHSTKLVFLYRKNFPKEQSNVTLLLVCLEAFSIFEGEKKEEYISFEMDKRIPDGVIKRAVKKFGYQMKK